MRDAVERGGYKNRTRQLTIPLKTSREKLTTQQAEEIRQLYATGLYTQRQVASLYAVGKSTIQCVVAGRTWLMAE